MSRRRWRRRRTQSLIGSAALALLGFACGAGAENGSSPAPFAPASSDRRAAAPADQTAVAPSDPRTVAPQPFSGARAWEDLRAQVAFGPRPAGSPAILRTREYITAQLKAAGIPVREQPFTADSPNGPIRMANLIGTIPGTRPDRIAIGTHYDTKLFHDFRFVGASDGASSTAVVLELARALGRTKPEFAIELLFFDGEEAVVDWYRDNDNTYGSRHYVQEARRTGTLAGLKALILVDMVGDRDLRISRDSNSTPWLVDLVWESAARLGHRAHFPDALTTIDDDHMPFLRAGVPAVDIIDLDYPAWHTANDDLDRVSADSLQIVGDVVLDALPRIQQRLAAGR